MICGYHTMPKAPSVIENQLHDGAFDCICPPRGCAGSVNDVQSMIVALTMPKRAHTIYGAPARVWISLDFGAPIGANTGTMVYTNTSTKADATQGHRLARVQQFP